MNYRKLKTEEIEQLKKNGCSSDNWDTINVAEKFAPNLISNVNLSGIIKIGNNVRLRNIYR